MPELRRSLGCDGSMCAELRRFVQKRCGLRSPITFSNGFVSAGNLSVFRSTAKRLIGPRRPVPSLLPADNPPPFLLFPNFYSVKTSKTRSRKQHGELSP